MNVKQVIVIRKDLKMRRGKEIAQGAHAAMKWLVERVRQVDTAVSEAYSKGATNCIPHELSEVAPGIPLTVAEDQWIYGLFTKICLVVDSEAELEEIYQKAKDKGLEVHMVTDSGATEFNGVPTKTCLAIGPDEARIIDPITEHLRLY